MSGASTSTSLATRARRLTALARAKKANEQESQELGQIQTALGKLSQELTKLESALVIQVGLRDAGLSVDEVSGLDEAPQKLQAHIDTVGRPTPQYLNARIKEVTVSRAAIEDANARAWHTWADQQLDDLPIALVPRIPMSRRSDATTRIATLRKMAASTPTISDIIQFRQSLELVKDDLDMVGVATVDEVLKRFAGGRIRLADLTDAELEMLRDDEELRGQLYVYLAP